MADSSENVVRGKPWAMTVQQVLDGLQVDEHSGLSSSEASARTQHFGGNELRKPTKTPLWRVFLEQFDDTLVKASLPPDA